MIRNPMRYAGWPVGLLVATLLPAVSFAQGAQSGKKLPLARVTPSHARATAENAAAPMQASDVPSYKFTLISFPGTLNTLGVGINPQAIPCEDGEDQAIEVVGAEFFPDSSSQTGFLAQASKQPELTETYALLNDPQAPTPQQAYSINDVGETVGDYVDAKGIFHSYLLQHSQYTPLNVPFSGAMGTYSPAINNAGEIVGSWNDSAGNAHGYTLKEGKFVSFDVPGASQAQFYYGINSQGDITGSYADGQGNIHGFLRQGKTYTTLDFPGAVYTVPSGINDADEIVGGYCLTTVCLNTGEGELGFLLKNGVYTTFAFPSEFAVGLASINNKGVLMGNYIDAAGLIYTFLATP